MPTNILNAMVFKKTLGNETIILKEDELFG